MSDLVEGWEVKKIKEICTVGRGRVISREYIEQNLGSYPVYSSQSFDKGRMGAIDTYDFDGEYVTWTTDGAYAGTVFYRDGKFNCTNVCGTLKVNNDRLSTRFLAYRLSTTAKDYVSYIGNPKLMNGVMANIEVFLPTSKSEQTKIAEVLETIDKTIEQTETLIAKQEHIKTGLMQDLLTKGIDENGNIRSEETHAFKDSPLGRIPVEWEVVKISFFVQRLDAGVSVNADDIPCGSGQIGVLKTSALSGGIFTPEQNKTVYNNETRRVRTPVEANTILISRMNTPALVGESCYVDCDYPQLFLPDRIWVLRIFKDLKPVTKWLSYILISSESKGYIALNASGTSATMKNLSKQSLLDMPVKAPINQQEQIKISECLDKIQMEIGGLHYLAAKLHSLKTALMQDLLTGRKRVTSLLTERGE